MLHFIVEPIVLVLKSDHYGRRFPMTCNEDLFRLRFTNNAAEYVNENETPTVNN